ncbi:MAG: GNAT family N-acetyltransferase [Eubacteriales bacterium]|nr:GNAT family N-acetyltransferase [Eubacteriales bacterium]
MRKTSEPRECAMRKPGRANGMEYVNPEGDSRYREQMNALLREAWGDVNVVAHGEWFDLTACDMFLCVDFGEVIGAVHFIVTGNDAEILSLLSRREHAGIGRALMRLAADACRARGMRCLRVVTTNDNARAFRFYQRFGMELETVRLRQVDVSRRMKPLIPLTGCDGIPIRDELQLVLKL